ncbi:hypothetical protein [Dyella flagellata]|uniref:hypothetical protein n=1 Tax=Dyella flagellata TaxID=1867833 RepID=UPI0024E10378|nr:hypothetical protein [Dyella flagellata]
MTPPDQFHAEIADVTFEFHPDSGTLSNSSELWVGRFYVQIPRVGDIFPGGSYGATIHFQDQSVELSQRDSFRLDVNSMFHDRRKP